ncbi:MAG: hypothetical protein QXL96_00395 [Ignisphaera sp.]
MKNTASTIVSSNMLAKDEGRSKTINLGSGITVIINDVRKVGEDLLDEIAAAMVAIKMYLSSKKKNRKNLKYRSIGNRQKDRKISIWFKSWLGEAMKEFECNPYRQDHFKNQFLAWP